MSERDRDIATTSKTGTDGFKSDVQRLGQYVGQLHDDLAGIAKTAGEAAHSGVALVRDGGKDTSEAAKRKSDLAVASIRSRISEHPGATLGIAVGIGVLIGLLGPAIARSRTRAS